MRRLRQLRQALRRHILEFRLALNTLDEAVEHERHRQAMDTYARAHNTLQDKLGQLNRAEVNA